MLHQTAMVWMKKTGKSLLVRTVRAIPYLPHYRYSGVRRQQEFPPLGSTTNSSNKYTPPARRAPTAQSTVSGAPVDPAIISSQLARPDKSVTDKKPSPSPKGKIEAATPPNTTESSVIATPESKTPVPKATSSSASRNASPQVKADGYAKRNCHCGARRRECIQNICITTTDSSPRARVSIRRRMTRSSS